MLDKISFSLLLPISEYQPAVDRDRPAGSLGCRLFDPAKLPPRRRTYAVRDAGISFKLDCYHHAIFVVRQWPRRTFPGMVAASDWHGIPGVRNHDERLPKRRIA